MEQQQPIFSQENEIDLLKLAQKVWEKRKFVLKACGIGVIMGLIIAFSIPKEYKTVVKLSPENSQSNKTGQLGGLAAMAGISLGNSSGSDALTIDLYPDIIASSPFLLELVNLPVETKKGNLKISFYEYITKHQKIKWWSYLGSAPFKALAWIMSLFNSERRYETGIIDPFNLTDEQEKFIHTLRDKITLDVNKKTGVIDISIMMQDPLISATVSDTVLVKLQTYITDYRTRKSKHNLLFCERLFAEAKGSYYKAQKKYAVYVDANKNIVSASFRTEEERLRNEMSLTYDVYNQMARQLATSKIKVQEQTPIYVVIEPARVITTAVKPSKMMILIGFVFFAGFVSVGWILIKSVLVDLRKVQN